MPKLEHLQQLLLMDSRFPAGLRDLSDPPATLTVRGRLPFLDRGVAIVGTRSADEDALCFARDLGSDLGRASCVVISGGARGIDASAHEGALSVDAPTIAVLATGVLSAYPPSHAKLFERIARHGALVSEHASTVVPHPGRFLARNRLIAALARVIVVVQAPARSGALSTARHALRLGRPVLTVPAAPWDPRGAGCVELLRDGAALCTGPRDVLSVLGATDSGPGRRGPGRRDPEPPELPTEEAAVHAALARASHLDPLVRRTGMPVAVVQRALLSLTLSGFVRRLPDGRYRVV